MPISVFRDRREAGAKLAERLVEEFESVDCVVGIPRGGIATAEPVARRFACPLVPVFVAKVRHPLQPEYAIGAVDEQGDLHLSDVNHEFLSASELEHAIAQAKETIARKKERFASVIPRFGLRDKVVVVVDDGLATGETCLAALRYLRSFRPKRLILAVPCASTSGVEKVASACDSVVSLIPPDPAFMSVGQYYLDFTQVEDDDVFAILQSLQPGVSEESGAA